MNNKYEYATFKSDNAPAEVIEGGLSYKVALSKAKRLWKSGKEYGVMVVSQDPNSSDPIQWIMTKSKIIDSLPEM